MLICPGLYEQLSSNMMCFFIFSGHESRQDRGRSSGHSVPGKTIGHGGGGGDSRDASGGAVGGAVGGVAGGSVPSSSSYLEDRLTLVVDNTRFVVDPGIFTQHPNTMLGR